MKEKTYYQLNKYKESYSLLEYALDVYKESNDLDADMSYKDVALTVLYFVDSTFSYIPNRQERVVNFLQGLGLDIPYTYYDIYQLGYKTGRLLETDTDTKHSRFAENYWRFMAMRLINIAESK